MLNIDDYGKNGGDLLVIIKDIFNAVNRLENEINELKDMVYQLKESK